MFEWAELILLRLENNFSELEKIYCKMIHVLKSTMNYYCIFFEDMAI
jgi:hypothetical protein